jgi:hypothetical protein
MAAQQDDQLLNQVEGEDEWDFLATGRDNEPSPSRNRRKSVAPSRNRKSIAAPASASMDGYAKRKENSPNNRRKTMATKTPGSMSKTPQKIKLGQVSSYYFQNLPTTPAQLSLSQGEKAGKKLQARNDLINASFDAGSLQDYDGSVAAMETSYLSSSTSSSGVDPLNQSTLSDTTELTASNFVLAATSRQRLAISALQQANRVHNDKSEQADKENKSNESRDSIAERAKTSTTEASAVLRENISNKADSSTVLKADRRQTIASVVPQGNQGVNAAIGKSTPNGAGGVTNDTSTPTVRRETWHAPSPARHSGSHFTEWASQLKARRLQRQQEREQELTRRLSNSSDTWNSLHLMPKQTGVYTDKVNLSVSTPVLPDATELINDSAISSGKENISLIDGDDSTNRSHSRSEHSSMSSSADISATSLDDLFDGLIPSNSADDTTGSRASSASHDVRDRQRRSTMSVASLFPQEEERERGKLTDNKHSYGINSLSDTVANTFRDDSDLTKKLNANGLTLQEKEKSRDDESSQLGYESAREVDFPFTKPSTQSRVGDTYASDGFGDYRSSERGPSWTSSQEDTHDLKSEGLAVDARNTKDASSTPPKVSTSTGSESRDSTHRKSWVPSKPSLTPTKVTQSPRLPYKKAAPTGLTATPLRSAQKHRDTSSPPMFSNVNKMVNANLLDNSLGSPASNVSLNHDDAFTRRSSVDVTADLSGLELFLSLSNPKHKLSTSSKYRGSSTASNLDLFGDTVSLELNTSVGLPKDDKKTTMSPHDTRVSNNARMKSMHQPSTDKQSGSFDTSVDTEESSNVLGVGESASPSRAKLSKPSQNVSRGDYDNLQDSPARNTRYAARNKRDRSLISDLDQSRLDDSPARNKTRRKSISAGAFDSKSTDASPSLKDSPARNTRSSTMSRAMQSDEQSQQSRTEESHTDEYADGESASHTHNSSISTAHPSPSRSQSQDGAKHIHSKQSQESNADPDSDDTYSDFEEVVQYERQKSSSFSISVKPHILNSALRKPGSAKRTGDVRRVVFGSPEVAEFHISSPSVSMTPIPSRRAKMLYTMPDDTVEIETDMNALMKSIEAPGMGQNAVTGGGTARLSTLHSTVDLDDTIQLEGSINHVLDQEGVPTESFAASSTSRVNMSIESVNFVAMAGSRVGGEFSRNKAMPLQYEANDQTVELEANMEDIFYQQQTEYANSPVICTTQSHAASPSSASGSDMDVEETNETEINPAIVHAGLTGVVPPFTQPSPMSVNTPSSLPGTLPNLDHQDDDQTMELEADIGAVLNFDQSMSTSTGVRVHASENNPSRATSHQSLTPASRTSIENGKKQEDEPTMELETNMQSFLYALDPESMSPEQDALDASTTSSSSRRFSLIPVRKSPLALFTDDTQNDLQLDATAHSVEVVADTVSPGSSGADEAIHISNRDVARFLDTAMETQRKSDLLMYLCRDGASAKPEPVASTLNAIYGKVYEAIESTTEENVDLDSSFSFEQADLHSHALYSAIQGSNDKVLDGLGGLARHVCDTENYHWMQWETCCAEALKEPLTSTLVEIEDAQSSFDTYGKLFDDLKDLLVTISSTATKITRAKASRRRKVSVSRVPLHGVTTSISHVCCCIGAYIYSCGRSRISRVRDAT